MSAVSPIAVAGTTSAQAVRRRDLDRRARSTATPGTARASTNTAVWVQRTDSQIDEYCSIRATTMPTMNTRIGELARAGEEGRRRTRRSPGLKPIPGSTVYLRPYQMAATPANSVPMAKQITYMRSALMPMILASSGFTRVALIACRAPVKRSISARATTMTIALDRLPHVEVQEDRVPAGVRPLRAARSTAWVSEPHSRRMMFSPAMARPSAATNTASSAVAPAFLASGR